MVDFQAWCITACLLCTEYKKRIDKTLFDKEIKFIASNAKTQGKSNQHFNKNISANAFMTLYIWGHIFV